MSIKYDVPMSDYLAMSALGSSIAFEAITRSPFHARHKRSGGGLWAKAADIGTVAHKMLLENSEEGIVLVEADDFRTKAAREVRDLAYSEGKTPILAHQIVEVRRMVESVRETVERSEVAGAFGNGQAEVTVDWEDCGIICKARPDYLTQDFHISLKTTTGSAHPATWVRQRMTPYGYDFGLAFYRRGLLANGIDVQHRLLVVEQGEPYGVCVIALAPDKQALADAMVEEAITTWAECLETATFPSYASQTHYAEASAWELAEAEEREYAIGIGA